MILAGDVGGTKVNVAFYDDELQTVVEESFPSAWHAGLGEILALFLKQNGLKPDAAAFGVAGPVREGRSKTTNLPWVVDTKELAAQLNLPSVGLINDLEATAYGIEALPSDSFVVLNEGEPDLGGNAAVIAAGTGLGEAGMHRHGIELVPFACEGGHSGFTPRNETEVELLRWLFTKYEYPDVENVLSGPGLYNVYKFLKETGRGVEQPWMTEEMKKMDPSACVSRAALEGTDPMSLEAMHIFVEIYGTEAANLAFKIMATGGVYLGGGIAPKILPKLQDGRFMKAFHTTGPLRAVLEKIPVRVMLNDKAALLGAAVFARKEHARKEAHRMPRGGAE